MRTPDWLDRAREIQESVQFDECRIERSSGTVFNRESKKDEEAWELVWEGSCRFPRSDAAGRVIVTGETITPAQPVVKVPWDVVGVKADDRVTCTASITPQNVGRVLWVDSDNPRTFQSATHLTCREVR